MARAFDWQSRGRRFDSVRLHEVGVSVGVIVWVWGVWKGEEFEPGLREKSWFFVFASILAAYTSQNMHSRMINTNTHTHPLVVL